MFKWNLLYVSFCACCFLSWAPLRRIRLLSLLPSSGFSSFLFSRLNSCSSLASSPYVRCSKPFIIFLVLCCSFFSRSISLLSWGDQSWAQHSRGVSPVLSGGLGVPIASSVLTVEAALGLTASLLMKALGKVFVVDFFT